MSSISGNIVANQSAYNPYTGGAGTPYSQGMADFSGPFGLGQGLVRGVGTVQIGPAGVSTSVPFAPGTSATAANTHNGLGLASPFGTTNSYLNQLGMNSFGQVNPYTPLIGTPWDIPNSIMALGSFGGLSNSMSPYTGAGLPTGGSQMAFGGPGGGVGGGVDPFAYPGSGGGIPGGFGGAFPAGGAGNAGASNASGGYPVPQGTADPYAMAAAYGQGGGYPTGGFDPYGGGGGYPTGGIDPYAGGGGYPPTGGGYPVGGGGGYPVINGGQGQSDGSGLFAPIDQNSIPGIAQSFSHQGENFANRYNLISDGVARLFLQGQGDPNTPRSAWGSGSSLRSPYGIFESGVGWAGGNANAGVMGAQASGMAWAMVRNPANPAMITSYANPYYNNYNFNEGFTNA